MRRAQTAIEFLILSGFMLLVFTTFFLVIRERTNSAAVEAQEREFQVVANTIEEEVLLASKVRDGYARTFELPLAVADESYVVLLYPRPPLTATEVVLQSSDREYVFFLQSNLSNISSIGPGYNNITKRGTNITINAAVKLPPMCRDADCAALAPACNSGSCQNGVCAFTPMANGLVCNDGDACTTSDTCQAGACTAGSPVVCTNIGETCVAGSCVFVCLEVNGNTTQRYMAGTGVNEGYNWNPNVGALSRDSTGTLTVCCPSNDYCVSASNVCVPRGVHSAPQFACENTGLGTEFFLCDSTHDGHILNTTLGGYCCSNNSAGASKGSYAFNSSGTANKAEALATAGSCNDGSDNDCDGMRDSNEPLCWNALLNSSCGGNSRFENLTAFPNATLAGPNRTLVDWRLGSPAVSIATVNMNFDIENSSGRAMTRDYSSYGNNGTLGGNTVLNGGLEAGALVDATNWVESTAADRVNDKAFTGTWSLKHVAPVADQGSWEEGMPLRASTTYVLSGWIYNNLSGAGVSYLDMNDTVWECQATAVKHNIWEYVSCQFTTPAVAPLGVVRTVTSGMGAANTGSAWFDDVRISIKGPAWSSTGGRNGSGAYVFDGIDDVINVTDTANPASYTIEAWVKPAAVASRSIIVRTNGQGPNAAFSHQLRINAAGKFEHYLWDGAPKAIASTTSPVVNTWYHVVGVAQANSFMRIYVNGREEGTPVAIGTPWNGGNQWNIGSSGAGLAPFSGTIDEVRVYGRNLSPEQITLLSRNWTNRTAPQELRANDIWSACPFVNNGTREGDGACTNAITVTALASACITPDAVTIVSSCNAWSKDEDLIATAVGTSFTGQRLTYDWRYKPSAIPPPLVSIAILQLTFENAGATTSKDYTSYGHTTTAGPAATGQAPTWGAATGRLGTGGYTFDGNKDYLQTTSSELQTANDFTLTAWIKPTAGTLATGSGTNGLVFWQGESSASGFGGGSHQEMDLGFGWSSNKISFFLGNADPSDPGVLFVEAPYADTTSWHFVAVRVKTLNSAPHAEMQIDGTSFPYSDDGTVAKTSRTNWDTSLRLGRFIDTLSGYHYAGGIDDVRIYNRYLSPSQVTALYNDRAMNLTQDETDANADYTVCVTSNNGVADITTMCAPTVNVFGHSVRC